MPKITAAKQNLPKLSFSESAASRFIKDKGRQTSPRQRPNMQYAQVLQRHKVKQLSCPIKTPAKRLLYECPQCHRFRNFLDDRDKFILYGVTRLWPTPPPAPPPISSPSPQIGDASSSPTSLEGAYNICRIFHTRSAKLHPRSTYRKKNTTTTPAVTRTSPGSKKLSPKRKPPSVPAPSSTKANTSSGELTQMMHLLNRCLSPSEDVLYKKSTSPKVTVKKIEAVKTETPITECTVNTLAASKTVNDLTSPQRSRACVRNANDSKSVKTTTSLSTVPTRKIHRQSISPARLEVWTKRLRNGMYLKNTDCIVLSTDTTDANTVSGDSCSQKKRKKRKKKNLSSKRTRSKTKTREKSQINNPDSPGFGLNDTSSCDKVHAKSVTSPSVTGQGSSGNVKLANVIVSSSRSETAKNRRSVVKLTRRPSRGNNSDSGDVHQELMSNTKVISNIEAVKIGEEKATSIKKRLSKRPGTKKTIGSVNLTEVSFTPEIVDTSDIEAATPIKNALSCSPSSSTNRPATLLQEFKTRMKKCQGKGSITSSHIEVMAYLEGKKSETKFQTLPKTYQQMGLAPLTRSPSSENCAQFIRLAYALSDTEIVPKTSLGGHSRRKKKKRKRDKSMPNSSTRKTDGEIIKIKVADEIRNNEKVRTIISQGKQKIHRHQQMSTAAEAVSTINTVIASTS